jgi:ABC-type amino acid transport substrate-binding protein
MNTQSGRKALRLPLVAAMAAAALVLSACASGDTTGDSAAPEGDGLMTPGVLVVGMNLQYKPQMYLDGDEPAGYDIKLLNALADEMGVTLEIKNLDFAGLIPGLQAKQFDMVSVGLSATDERKKVIDFSRGYVPYSSILAVAEGASTSLSIDELNQEGVVITALQGSSNEQLIRDNFPNATVSGFPDQNAALLEVATGRAAAVVVEDYILAQFSVANPNQLAQAKLDGPLSLYYGSWAVQKGNRVLVSQLDTFLCKVQNDGTLAGYFKSIMAPEMPDMPGGC